MKKLEVLLMIIKESFPTILIGLGGLIILGLGISTNSLMAEWLGTGFIGICIIIFWIITHVNVN